VDTYINNNKPGEVWAELLASDDYKTLFVNLRSGRNGFVDEYYINAILHLMTTCDKIVILETHYLKNVPEVVNNIKIIGRVIFKK
jgi:hypothetical protein